MGVEMMEQRAMAVPPIEEVDENIDLALSALSINERDLREEQTFFVEDPDAVEHITRRRPSFKGPLTGPLENHSVGRGVRERYSQLDDVGSAFGERADLGDGELLCRVAVVDVGHEDRSGPA